MFRRLRTFLVALSVLGLFAPPALASALATVTSITGSAVVMRGNKVEKLYVGAKIEKGDRVLVASGGRVTLSGGTVLGPGTSTVANGKSGVLQITSSSSASSYAPKSNSSKLFSNKTYGNDDDEDDDDDDEDDDEDEDDEHGNPDDPKGVSY